MAYIKSPQYYRLKDLLESYYALQQGLESLKAEYESKSKEIGFGINYDKEPISKTYAFSSITENIGINLMELTIKIERAENKIKRIENALTLLDQDERNVIKLKYFERLSSWEYIGQKLNMSEKTARRKRNKAIGILLIALMGEVD